MKDGSRELETQLIRKVREGGREFFEPLVRAHEAEAHRVALAILGDGDSAGDAVQEAFIKAFKALDSFELGRSFRPWFLQILRNQCRDILRRRKAGFETQRMTPVMAERLASPSNPERERHRSEARALVWEALGRVSVDHREVLVMKEIQGLPYHEIAEALEVPEGTVASRLYHARRALKDALDEMGVEYP